MQTKGKYDGHILTKKMKVKVLNVVFCFLLHFHLRNHYLFGNKVSNNLLLTLIE